MKKNKKLLNSTLSLVFASAILFSGLNTYAIAENESSADMPNVTEEMVVDSQVNSTGLKEFDPLDTTPLTNSEVPTPAYEQMYEGHYYTGKSYDECRAEYEKVANAIIAKINPAWSDFRKLAYIHDFICLNADYDYETYNNTTNDLIGYSAYGNLVLHKSVCDGYARAFYDLANRAGIETYYVTGKVETERGIGDHAWNASKLMNTATAYTRKLWKPGSIILQTWC